jgi:hypothetical protein
MTCTAKSHFLCALQVQDNLSSPASAQEEQREDFKGECLKCTGDSNQTPSMLTTTRNAPALDHQHHEGISPDLQIAEQAPSGVFNTSDKVSPIWGVATASLSNFEHNVKSSASIATEDLHELLKVRHLPTHITHQRLVVSKPCGSNLVEVLDMSLPYRRSRSIN